MTTVITAFIILVCLLLILVVLIQNSKGGGLSSQFAGSNQIMGVRRTADFLEKATYTLAILLLVLSLLSSASISKAGTTSEAPESKTSETKAKALEGVPSGLKQDLAPKQVPPSGNQAPAKKK
jgi:preprotein translocase subunit SecG